MGDRRKYSRLVVNSPVLISLGLSPKLVCYSIEEKVGFQSTA
jgi:hypothetical protein